MTSSHIEDRLSEYARICLRCDKEDADVIYRTFQTEFKGNVFQQMTYYEIKDFLDVFFEDILKLHITNSNLIIEYTYDLLENNMFIDCITSMCLLEFFRKRLLLLFLCQNIHVILSCEIHTKYLCILKFLS